MMGSLVSSPAVSARERAVVVAAVVEVVVVVCRAHM